MKVIGVIPARWGSTRFEGKVLAKISGKPMIQHVWERAGQSRRLDELIIACDDKRVLEAAQQFGATAVLTSPDHPSGSDRIAEAVAQRDVDIVINIQGDEPLIQSSVIDDLARALLEDPSCVMATAIKVLDKKEELLSPNVVKVVVDKDNNALYFSRSVIPYNRDDQTITYYKHLGIYAYRKDFLFTFKELPKSLLEKAEKLEQLRVLESGFKIKTVVTDIETVGVDTPEDLACVEWLLKDREQKLKE
ncbi:MAG TPA: 3-deoxy-manno-octulosonate cytidylyltransferase [Candidatus Omnitrophica bacterium]|nr:MAG: 3-deoxy-manno-octulosonate cytidylyltransferase [Omnitrophica WOR_2 bacterium GWA2_45_18]OGX21107.1 MAG: 3-deoxy-manno-octulosonate cytidylyltransferase [Omnitrophica WOR_2 bacterium GWC2_45_7]HBR15179.1 3-deoxy-manno-octulosonate cytidylyltransferase [Candidatus Omnitrophota bacterium]